MSLIGLSIRKDSTSKTSYPESLNLPIASTFPKNTIRFDFTSLIYCFRSRISSDFVFGTSCAPSSISVKYRAKLLRSMSRISE